MLTAQKVAAQLQLDQGYRLGVYDKSTVCDNLKRKL
jgi:hypothetical protein